MCKDRVAIVTGASRGIGRSIALALAEAGAKIVAVDISLDGTQELIAEIEAKGTQAIALKGNVTSAEDVDSMIAEAVQAFGRIDILINNAGITRDALLLRMKDEDWEAVINVNLKGTFLCSRAAAKVMAKQRYGRIVNIASIVGQMGNAGQANYCASKAGLLGLTKSVARELARRSVTVNAITPGFIVTDMTENMTDKAREAMTEQIPLGRLGDAADIASAVIFLASDQSAYITGQVLGVNGGMYM